VSGYVGLLLFSTAAVALGLLVSALTESQVIAFFVTFIIMLALLFLGEIAQHVPNALGTILREISFMEHFTPFQRGLIDTRDVVFFISCAALALMFAFRALESRKWT
jgi:ABC-2 type transport system permease protein